MLFQHIKLPLQENLILPELPENIFLINKIFCMWKSWRIHAFHSFMALVPTQSPSLMFLLLFIRHSWMWPVSFLPWGQDPTLTWSSGQTALEVATALQKDHVQSLQTKGESTDPLPIMAGWLQIGNQRCKWESRSNPNWALLRQELQYRVPSVDNSKIVNTNRENRKYRENGSKGQAGMQEHRG